MITLKQIEQKYEAIRVSKEEWNKVAKILDENGYRWNSGEKYTEFDVFDHMPKNRKFVYLVINGGTWVDNYDAIKTEIPVHRVSNIKEFKGKFMITLKQIIKQNRPILVPKKDWDKLAKILDKEGYKFNNGDSYTDEKYISEFKNISNILLYLDIGKWAEFDEETDYTVDYVDVSDVYEFSVSPEMRLFRAIFDFDSHDVGESCSGQGHSTESTAGEDTPSVGLSKFIIDPENKVCVFYFRGKKYVITCHEQDRFDWRVGVGVMYSRYMRKNKSLNYLRKIMREKQYYIYCFKLLFDFDTTLIESVVAEYENEYKQLQLDEQVRQSECEIRKTKYEPKKIVRKFKEVNL